MSRKQRSPYHGSHMHGMFGIGQPLGVIGGLTGLPSGLNIIGTGLGGVVVTKLNLTLPQTGTTLFTVPLSGLPLNTSVAVTNPSNSLVPLEYTI